jgi:hypothetical protein
MGKRQAIGLTPRQREWLRHLREAEGAGESIRGYAQRHGLSEHSMYQAAKDLRRKGALAPSGRKPAKRVVRGRPVAAHRRFVEVKTSRDPAPRVAASAWRVRLPNGVVVEGSGDLGAVLEALHRL